ncbi:uncharacterized protein LOC124121902 isoform X1 [Haliotis rufescens]|uniref:uncharacterized protein LOC124121902 isoform X1 n=1 Tax=Haliotis rufescens TaxID=6454 RepID=UPI00201F8122|nr:uncharacterized protein LOC124121902 isoform X1 [Haliotis rufescens]
MYSMWASLLSLVWVCESAGCDIIFTAEPHHLHLHGLRPPWFILSCNTSDVTDVYIMEIGRHAHADYPVAYLSAVEPHAARVLDKPNRHRISSQGRIEATSSHLQVNVTDVLCEDVTSYYCVVFFGNSSRKSIQEDRRMVSVKGSDVTMEITPSTFVPGQTTNISITCIFEKLTSDLHTFELGRKHHGEKSLIAALNTTHVVPMDGSVSKRLTLIGEINNSSMSRLEATLSPATCNDVTEYYCTATFTSGGKVKATEDTSEVTGTCYDTTTARLTTRHPLSTNSGAPRIRHPRHSSGAPAQVTAISTLLGVLILGHGF